MEWREVRGLYTNGDELRLLAPGFDGKDPNSYSRVVIRCGGGLVQAKTEMADCVTPGPQPHMHTVMATRDVNVMVSSHIEERAWMDLCACGCERVKLRGGAVHSDWSEHRHDGGDECWCGARRKWGPWTPGRLG